LHIDKKNKIKWIITMKKTTTSQKAAESKANKKNKNKKENT